MSNYVGEILEIKGTYRESGTTPTDADSVVVVVTSPSGASTTYTYNTNSEVTRLSTGVYLCSITPDAVGRWTFKFTVTKNSKSDIEYFHASVRANPV